MSKPVFMRLHQNGVPLAVNMSQVAYIAPNNKDNIAEKSVLYFPTWADHELLYLVVDEPIDEIANRREWHQ